MEEISVAKDPLKERVVILSNLDQLSTSGELVSVLFIGL